MLNKQHRKQTSPEHVKRHVKERLFNEYAAHTPKALVAGTGPGVAQRAWYSWGTDDRIRMLADYCGVPRNQTHLFYDRHWVALSLYLKRKIKGFFRNPIPYDHPLQDLRYGE